MTDDQICAGADPAEVAQRAGNSVEVLLSRYAKCLYDRQSINNQRIEGLLSPYDRTPGLDGRGEGQIAHTSCAGRQSAVIRRILVVGPRPAAGPQER